MVQFPTPLKHPGKQRVPAQLPSGVVRLRPTADIPEGVSAHIVLLGALLSTVGSEQLGQMRARIAAAHASRPTQGARAALQAIDQARSMLR